MITTGRNGPTAAITLERPEARNALTGATIGALGDAFAGCDSDPRVRVIMLTGRDPAFCAGLDLNVLARTYDDLTDARPDRGTRRRGLQPDSATPIIGAVNGPAVTGRLELAFGYDFLIASRRASFADTHARVGVMPGGGMTIRLPQLIGINRARQMSLTGNFVDAATACEWGLVNVVVPHQGLMARTLELAAAAIGEAEPATIRELRSMDGSLGHRSDDEAYLKGHGGPVAG